MEIQNLFDIVFGLLIATIGFFMKTLYSKTERNSEDLSRFKEYVALNHPVNDSIDKRFDKLEIKIDKILDKMDER